MSSRLNPYLSFDGNGREAMETYRSIFGGELAITTFGEYGAAEGDHADRIMHAQLDTTSGYTIMGADTPPHEKYEPGNTVSVSISGTDADELRGYWEKLSVGGSVAVPLSKQMWGDEFGMCTDRFGVAWLVNIGQPEG